MLERLEDRIPFAYPDSEGYWTIGIGHLIDKRKGGTLPDFIIDRLLEYDISQCVSQLNAKIPWWRGLSETRQRALVVMCFQLGIGGLLGFKKMLSALKDERWKDAKREALDSLWARQTPARAKEVAGLLDVTEQETLHN
jgi:lysozyme